MLVALAAAEAVEQAAPVGQHCARRSCARFLARSVDVRSKKALSCYVFLLSHWPRSRDAWLPGCNCKREGRSGSKQWLVAFHCYTTREVAACICEWGATNHCA
jgi:hypothetical protein